MVRPTRLATRWRTGKAGTDGRVAGLLRELVRAKGRDRVVGIVDQVLKMRTAGVKPAAHIYNVLIEACGVARDISKAFEVFADMKAAKVTPAAGTYTALINACGAAGDLSKAFEVVAERPPPPPSSPIRQDLHAS